jgi:sulfur relay (sulfurtransferase) complex TusBCD TusD component (DsrE family)
MFFLIVVSSDSPKKIRLVHKLASASIRNGHQVTIFFFMLGVKLLDVSGVYEWSHSLIEAGVRLLACRTSTTDLGITFEGPLFSGVELSSLGELVELMDRCDRTLFLG